MAAFVVVAVTAAPATAKASDRPVEQARELSSLLGAAWLHAARAAMTCEGVPPTTEAGSNIIPEGLRMLFPPWKGGLDARWLRERADHFGQGFDAVLDHLTATHPEAAAQIKSEFAQAAASGVLPARDHPVDLPDRRTFLADPERAALYCSGLRRQVEAAGSLLSAVPR